MEFGSGVTAEVNDNVELSLGYEGKFREDYQDHTGLLNAKYTFFGYCKDDGFTKKKNLGRVEQFIKDEKGMLFTQLSK